MATSEIPPPFVLTPANTSICATVRSPAASTSTPPPFSLLMARFVTSTSRSTPVPESIARFVTPLTSVTPASVSVTLPPVRSTRVLTSTSDRLPTTISRDVARPISSVSAVIRSPSASLRLKLPAPPSPRSIESFVEGCRKTVPAAVTFSEPFSDTSLAMIVTLPPAVVRSPFTPVVKLPTAFWSTSASMLIVPFPAVCTASFSVIPVSARSSMSESPVAVMPPCPAVSVMLPFALVAATSPLTVLNKATVIFASAPSVMAPVFVAVAVPSAIVMLPSAVFVPAV